MIPTHSLSDVRLSVRNASQLAKILLLLLLLQIKKSDLSSSNDHVNMKVDDCHTIQCIAYRIFCMHAIPPSNEMVQNREHILYGSMVSITHCWLVLWQLFVVRYSMTVVQSSLEYQVFSGAYHAHVWCTCVQDIQYICHLMQGCETLTFSTADTGMRCICQCTHQEGPKFSYHSHAS